MDWNTEFNIDIKQVTKEVRQIRKEKKIQYDDYGQAEPKRSYYQELREEKKVIYDDYGKAVPKRSYFQELRDRPC